jgi:hypothetical protein
MKGYAGEGFSDCSGQWTAFFPGAIIHSNIIPFTKEDQRILLLSLKLYAGHQDSLKQSYFHILALGMTITLQLQILQSCSSLSSDRIFETKIQCIENI